MQLLSIDAIQVPSNRQRKEFKQEELAELQASIEQVGLLHPLIVRQQNGSAVLVAPAPGTPSIQWISGTDTDMICIGYRADQLSIDC